MDPKCNQGSSVLSIAWLEPRSRRTDKGDHGGDKLKLSLESSFGEREAARHKFIAASSSSVDLRQVIELEAASRYQDRSEPMALSLRASCAAVVYAQIEEKRDAAAS